METALRINKHLRAIIWKCKRFVGSVYRYMCVFLPPPVFVGEFLCIVCVSVKSVEESPSATAWNGNETE